MSKKKKILLVVTATILLGLVIGVLIVRREDERQVSQTPLPSPDIPKSFEGEFGFTFDLDEEIELPESLPIVKVSPTPAFSEEKAREVASLFGYDFEPKVVQDIYDGNVYIWETDGSILYVRSNSRKIDYQAYIDPTSVINKQLSNDQVQRIARDFLIDNGLVTSSEAGFSSFVFYEVGQSTEGLFTTTKENADFYQVNFSPKFSGYQILTLNPDKKPITVTVLPDGSIYEAEVTRLGELKETAETFSTKTLEEVRNQIQNAVLVSLNDGNIFLEDLGIQDIQSMVIQDIKVAFFRESPTADIYQPIYLLKGNTRVRGFTQRVNATLYLPALGN